MSALTYDLRSGSPDFIRLVAFTFAGMAMDAVDEGRSGLMTAISEGRYVMALIPIPNVAHAKRTSHQCKTLSATVRRVTTARSLPIFLTRP